jgi:hypothetical protein
MPIRKPKPTSAGRRFITYADYAEITARAAKPSKQAAAAPVLDTTTEA